MPPKVKVSKDDIVEAAFTIVRKDGIAMFPDAPTERGAKHLRELISSKGDGYVPCVLFVIQMEDVIRFEPNRVTDPIFSDTLKEAKDSGVNVLAYTCRVTPDSLELSDPVEVLL